MSDNRKPLIVIAGPTAIGKTDISIKLAKRIGGQIISADSMQVYKGMDIGTAKISTEEMQGIKHYLIDELNPFDDFNIVYFQKRAKEAMNNIWDEGMIPIIVGGTGFYIQSVLYDIDFEDTREDSQYRDELTRLSEEKGTAFLHKMLEEVDNKAAVAIHENDLRRIIRALEYYKLTGGRISDHNESEREKKSPYNVCYFVINDDRDAIYERINRRVDVMIEQGLVDEVKGLTKRGLTMNNISMHGLGYKEILNYLEGVCSLDEAVDIIKRDTRHFAKRQLTWFKRERNVKWINKNSDEVMLDEMLYTLTKMNILSNDN